MDEILSNPMQPVFVTVRESGKLCGLLTEMASDIFLDNEGSILAHTKLGYGETIRLIHFVKKLDQSTKVD